MLAGFIALSGGARAAETATIAGNVAPWATEAAKVGTVDSGKQVSIVLHMSLRNPDRLASLVSDVSKPSSPNYGKYLSVAGFRARFAPDPADVAAAEALLTNAGMKNVKVGSAGAFVSADATVAQLASTFGVTQSIYNFRGRMLRANAELPTIPAALSGKILSIEGLHEGDLRHPHSVSAVEGPRLAPSGFHAEDSGTITPPPVAANLPSPYCDTYMGDLKAVLSTRPKPYDGMLPWLNCGYTPQQIQSAYGMNKTKLDGTGVTIAIIDAFASPTLMADGNAYAANHGLPPLTSSNFTQIIPDGIYNVPPDQVTNAYGWWGEESLDLAAVHGSAPGANIVYIGSTDNGTSLTVALDTAIMNRSADIMTNSYSFNGDSDDPSDIAAQNQAFMSADSMGITLLFSSGDDGDLSVLNGVATGAFESDSPYVTGVGGTTLFLRDQAGIKGEWGWGTYRDYLANATVNSGTSITTTGLVTTTAFGATFSAFAFYSGAGGGISLLAPQPDYQVGIVPDYLSTSLNLASGQVIPLPTKYRVAPDVAMDADPYTGYLIGETFTIAGNPISDAGCTATSSTTEYCELGYGGTSLASPLMAGVLAEVDQAHIAAGKPLVGFANPFLYAGKIGQSRDAAGINDVTAPTQPHALLRGYANDPTRVRVVTVNSVPFNILSTPYALQVCASKTCEGLDEIFNYTTAGYDDVTGLGVPYVPALAAQ